MSKKRIKYGICDNSECANYRLPVEMTEDGNCPLCHKKLETDDDTTSDIGGDIGGGESPKKKILLIIAAVVVVAIAVLVVIVLNSKPIVPPIHSISGDPLITKKDTTKRGTITIPNGKKTISDSDTLGKVGGVGECEVVEEPEKGTTTIPTAQSSGQTINLSGCTWTGPTSDGKPNGNGRMTFTQKRVIDSYDSEKRTAEKGEYIIGEWKNGHLVQGTLYAKSGKVKEVILIGVR